MITVSDLKTKYHLFCKEIDRPPESPQSFNAMIQQFTSASYERQWIDGSQERVWKNIEFIGGF